MGSYKGGNKRSVSGSQRSRPYSGPAFSRAVKKIIESAIPDKNYHFDISTSGTSLTITYRDWETETETEIGRAHV